MVVGADSVHTTMGQFVIDAGSPRFSDMCAYRSLVPAKNAPAFARRPVQTLWLGPNRHLVHYSISAGAQINIVAFGPAGDRTTESWSAEGRIEDLRAEFAGWSNDLQALLSAAERTGQAEIGVQPSLVMDGRAARLLEPPSADPWATGRAASPSAGDADAAWPVARRPTAG